MSNLSFRDAASNSVRFWEPARILYNLVLLAILIGYFIAGLPGATDRLSFDLSLGIFVMAVLANVAYCAAYPIDVFAQFTTFNGVWQRLRWIVFAIGLLFAAIITRFFAIGMFANPT